MIDGFEGYQYLKSLFTITTWVLHNYRQGYQDAGQQQNPDAGLG